MPYPDPPRRWPPSRLRPRPTTIEEQDRSLLDGTPYGEIIAAVSEAHGVDPLLVRALIQVESGYQPAGALAARARWG